MHELSPGGRLRLLGLARAAVEDAVRGDGSLRAALDRTPLSGELLEPRGAFVSLKIPPPPGEGRASLRGCIGNLVSREPLYRIVVDVAARAARDDPRFPPLVPTELPSLSIEISVLSPRTPLGRPQEVEIGRDGVALQKGRATAVFLPQVAAEQGWSAEQLLEQLALKAGLARDGWIGAELAVFRAEIFSDP